MRIKDRAGMALFSVIGIGLLFLVSSCIEAPEDNTTSDTSGPLVICDNVFSLNPGSLYRVQTNGLGLTKLAANLNVPWEAYVDPESGDLYFTEDGTGDCSGSVKRIQNPQSNSFNIETIAPLVDRPRRPVIFEGYLYFTEYKVSGSVVRVNLSTGALTRLVGGLNRPFGVAVDSDPNFTWVYFIEMASGTDGTVKKFRIDNENGFVFEPETLAMDLMRPVGIVMDKFYVYIAEMDGGRVFRMSKQAAIDPPFSPVLEDLVTGLTTPYPPVLETGVLGAHVLYFADFGNKVELAGKIYRRDGVDGDDGSVGMTPAAIAAVNCDGLLEPDCSTLSETLSWPMLVAIDDTNIYWSEVFSQSVKAVPLAGGDTTELVTTHDNPGLSKPLGIATDGDFVYFSDIGDNQCCF